jgi:hypothetical protein
MRRWEQVNAEWADYVTSPAFQELKAKLGKDDLLLRQIVRQHGAANAHAVIDVMSNDADVDSVRRLTRRIGLQGIHQLIDDIDKASKAHE